MSLSTLALTSALLLAGAASAAPVQANKASVSLERRWDYLKSVHIFVFLPSAF